MTDHSGTERLETARRGTSERLRRLGLLDAPSQHSFENLTRMASKVLDAPISLVTILDFEGDRQFFKSQVGLADPWAEGRETPLSHSFCQHVVRGDRSLIVENAPEHDLVCDNPAIRDLGVVAYLGVPVYAPENQPVGALCVIDTKPRAWDYEQVKMIRQLAQCVTDAIRLNAALLSSQEARQQQQEVSHALSGEVLGPIRRLGVILEETRVESAVLSPGVRGMLDEGQGMIRRIGRQLDALMAYSRVLGGTAGQRKSDPIDLDEVLGDILHEHKGDFCSLGAEVNAGPMPVITGDRSQIRTMLDHLVGNALRYRRSDIVPRVSIRSGRDVATHQTWISVRDNGIGIRPEDIERAFSLFTRLAGSGAPEGSGIGLPLCRRVAENHHGHIEVVSRPGEGSTFTVYLPDQRD